MSKMSKIAKQAKLLENYFLEQHNNPPLGFNPDFREGIGEAVSKAYSLFCENNTTTKEERKKEYRLIHERLESLYPSRRELYDKQAVI